MANELIAEAITEHYGERCPDTVEGCACCDAWAEYDALSRPAAPVEGVETVKSSPAAGRQALKGGE